MVDDLLHPKKIEDPPVFFIVLDILNPSSYSVAEGQLLWMDMVISTIKSLVPLAAAVTFTSGTFAVVGSTFNGCQCVALAYIFAISAVPLPVSFSGTSLLRFT
ncbi:MAG: hypothetical protein EZS28_028499 [Streblomastix strix]|uniref:Uncharacterized protein n=1 Tax=Streblomastix strix TaxID=222440 RepID=A0A5J4V0E6_9EUKA|nr:MAG: hypothetical protein EZS28_028499 [Streblomastix strix]